MEATAHSLHVGTSKSELRIQPLCYGVQQHCGATPPSLLQIMVGSNLGLAMLHILKKGHQVNLSKLKLVLNATVVMKSPTFVV